MIFLEALLFKLYFISLATIEVNQLYEEFTTFLLMLLVAYKEGDFLLLFLLFRVVSGLFQPVLAYNYLLFVVLLSKGIDVTKCFD